MFTYHQSSGLFSSPALHTHGYSGCNEGYNNPLLESHPNLGPIPAGLYSIGPAFTHALAGPLTMRLTPAPSTDTFNRDGFLIHGDTQLHAEHPSPQTSASHGCIILDHTTRATIAVGNDRQLLVVP